MHFRLPSRILILARYLLGPDYRSQRSLKPIYVRLHEAMEQTERWTTLNASNDPLSISDGYARYYRDTVRVRERAHVSFRCVCTSYVPSVCHPVYGYNLSNGKDTGVIFDRIIFEITLNHHFSPSRKNGRYTHNGEVLQQNEQLGEIETSTFSFSFYRHVLLF